LPYVVFNQSEGCYEGATLLLKQGRSGLLYIGDYPESYLSGLRQVGMRQAAESRGIESRELFNNDPDFERKLLSCVKDRGVDGIVAFNDLIAIRAMNVLIKSGVRVPDDVAVLGYDNSSHAEIAFVPLTSVKFDKRGLARAAFDTLERLIDGREAPKKQVVATELVVRESTRPSVKTMS
jgi:LacI family transcriptional regulator